MINKDENNAILSGDINGAIYPSCQKEILRNVFLKAPYNINGGIWTMNLKNDGGGIVTGPVMASTEITVTLPRKNNEPVRFLSGINSTLSIAVEESGKSLEESVMGKISNAGLIIRGDVVTNMIKLENALVIGNVRGRQITIVNCIIVGSLLAEEELLVENSNFVSFSGKHVVLKGNNGCWLPYGTALTPVEFKEARDCRGNTIPSQLRYLAVKKRDDPKNEEHWVGNFSRGICDETDTSEHALLLSPEDVELHRTQDGKYLYALNIARRALNLAPVEESINTIGEFLTCILMLEHLDAESREREKKEWPKKFNQEELKLLKYTLKLI